MWKNKHIELHATIIKKTFSGFSQQIRTVYTLNSNIVDINLTFLISDQNFQSTVLYKIRFIILWDCITFSIKIPANFKTDHSKDISNIWRTDSKLRNRFSFNISETCYWIFERIRYLKKKNGSKKFPPNLKLTVRKTFE